MAVELYKHSGRYTRNEMVYRVDTRDDLDAILENPPEGRTPEFGDRAIVIDDGSVWALNSNQEWKEQSSGGGSSGGTISFGDIVDVSKEGM